MTTKLLLTTCVCGLFSQAAIAAAIVWQAPIELAQGRGEKGPWQQNDSRYDYVDDGTVAIAGDGIYVAWVAQASKDVWLQALTLNGASRGAPLNVARSGATFSWLPRLAPAPGGEVFLLWQEIMFSGGAHGGEIFFACAQAGARSASTPRNLSRSRGGDGKGRITDAVWHNGSLDLAVGTNGAVFAAWTDYDGALWFARARDTTRSFSAPRRINAADKPARAPSLAVARDGTVYLAWTPGTDPAADIQLVRSNDGGVSFGPALAIAPGPDYSDAPKLAVDRNGRLHLAYAQTRGDAFEPAEIRYTYSDDKGVRFTVPRTVSAGDARFPDLVVDPQGGVAIVWERFSDAQLARGLGLALSRDLGANFAAPVPVPASADPDGGINGSHQGRLMRKLALGAGRIAIVNSALAEDRHSRVWLMQGRLTPLPPRS